VYRIGDVMVSVLASSAVEHVFESLTVKPKTCAIVIRSFSDKHAALRRKTKDWLALNQENVSERATCLSADCCFSELAL